MYLIRDGQRSDLPGLRKLASILNTVPDAMIVIDERGIIQSFSSAAERLFGFVAADVVGKNVKLLMPSPYRENHDSYLERYLRTGERRIIGIGRVVVGERIEMAQLDKACDLYESLLLELCACT